MEEKEKLIVMVKNLGLGHYGDILITTQERVAANQPPIASDLLDEAWALSICHCMNEIDKLRKDRIALLDACEKAKIVLNAVESVYPGRFDVKALDCCVAAITLVEKK